MRRIMKRTLTVTSTETWTISIECQQPIESRQTEEPPASSTQAITTRDDDVPPQLHTEGEAEDVKSTGIALSAIEKRRDQDAAT